MKDIKLYIDKLHADAEDCLTICQTASNEAKKTVFTALAKSKRKSAQESGAKDIECCAMTNQPKNLVPLKDRTEHGYPAERP